MQHPKKQNVSEMKIQSAPWAGTKGETHANQNPNKENRAEDKRRQV